MLELHKVADISKKMCDLQATSVQQMQESSGDN